MFSILKLNQKENDFIDRRKIFKYLSLFMFIIFFLNFLGAKFYLYYSLWYFDIFMHFLGGLWVAFLLFYFFFNKNFYVFVFQILLGVLLIGILWEIFEFFVNEIIATNPFNFLDTISDIFCDLAGGVLGLILYKKIFIKKENKV
jgi:hypothetical protein